MQLYLALESYTEATIFYSLKTFILKLLKDTVMLAGFDLLSADPSVLGGKPCVRGTRISVAMILEWLASGAERQDILSAYPQISEGAYHQALQYAALQVQPQILLDIEVAA